MLAATGVISLIPGGSASSQAPFYAALALGAVVAPPAEARRWRRFRPRAVARGALAKAALASLESAEGRHAEHFRYCFGLARDAARSGHEDRIGRKRVVGLTAIDRHRERLEALRRRHEIGPDAYLVLQEKLDCRQIAMTTEEECRIEES